MSFPKKRRTRETRAGGGSDGAPLEVAVEKRAHTGLSGLLVSAPPADLVTSERLKAVRFDLARPRGYHIPQVEALVGMMTSSLTWHEETLHKRDQGIHVLKANLVAATEQEATLRAQAEVSRVQGSVTVGAADADGQILRKSQVTAANDALVDPRGVAAAVDRRLAASIEEVRSMHELADVVIPLTAQISELAKVAQRQLERAAQELAADRKQSADVTGHVASLESQVAFLESQVASLESHVASLKVHVASLESVLGYYLVAQEPRSALNDFQRHSAD